MITTRAAREPSRRILVIDDNRDIHADFGKVFESFQPRAGQDAELATLETELFGCESHRAPTEDVRLDVSYDSAYQGEEGIRMALTAAAEGRPYYMAFVDVQMPPGIDGIHTIKELWAHDSDLQCVVCTAFSNYEWADIARELGESSNLLVLKKPFDSAEVLQLALALAKKVDLIEAARTYQRRLEKQVRELKRIESELQKKNELLEAALVEAKAANSIGEGSVGVREAVHRCIEHHRGDDSAGPQFV